MTPSRETTWALDPHTVGKHEVLRYYLDAWFPILGSRWRRVLFIDGFAGPGEYVGGEKGSPLIVLDVLQNLRSRFTAEAHLIFIEKEPKRSAHLKRLLAETLKPPHCSTEVLTGRFDEGLGRTLDALEQQGHEDAPAFVMIDPFGVSDTPMHVVRRILQQGEKTEVYVSLMYRDINRFLTTTEFKEALDGLFGTNEWEHAKDLAGESRRRFLFDLYARQLKTAGATQVLRFDLYEGNSFVYAIFFATHHWMGSDRMKKAIWKVEPFGDFEFHGTRSTQLTLGLETVDYSALQTALQNRFRDQGWVAIETVQEFVGSDETDFHTGQLKQPVLVPMETNGLIEVDPKTRKRRRSYPDGAKLRFK